MVYNIWVGEIRQRRDLKQCKSWAVMPTFTYTGSNAESMKGGMLMKSKHCIYGKKATCSTFYSYHFDDKVLHKSTIAAPTKETAVVKQ